MADKVDKPKKKTGKPRREEKGVMAALPSTRPDRIGTTRGAATSPPAPKTTTATTASVQAAEGSTPAKPPGKRKPEPKRGAKPAAPRVSAARPRAAAPRTFEPTQAAEAAAGASDERAAGAVPRAETPPTPRGADPTYPRPRPVSAGAPGIGTTGYRDKPAPAGGGPGGVPLVATAVKAAGDVAQVGLALGGGLLRRVLERVPRP